MKQFIIEQLQQLKVTDQGKLHEYVEFCLANDLKVKEPRKTANHHILPCSKLLPFKAYSNLKANPWNKVVLTNYNHYYAHFLLSKAISHISISHAFCAMHNKDLKKGRIEEKDLVSELEFNEIYAERNRHSSEYLKEIIEIDGVKMSRGTYINLCKTLSPEVLEARSNRMKGENNIVHMPGVVEQIRKTKLENNSDLVSAERAAATMKAEYIGENGLVTTIYRENAKKISKLLREEVTDENGNKITRGQKRGKSKQLQMIRDGKWYRIRNVFDPTVDMILPSTLVRKISPALAKKTQNDFLGKSAFGRNLFVKQSREYLIGLFAEQLSEAPQNYNLDQDHSPYL